MRDAVRRAVVAGGRAIHVTHDGRHDERDDARRRDARRRANENSGTGRTNDSVPQPRSSASRRSARSGFTANAWPTAPSIGASVIESEYA